MSITNNKQYAGVCLCGAVRYMISGGKPPSVFFCHCSRCRKETGTVHGANAFFSGARLEWQQGEANLTSFVVEGTRHSRAFCKTCGSPLPRQDGEQIVLPVGSLEKGTIEPTAHIYFAERFPWEDKLQDLQRFAGPPQFP